MRLVPLPEPDRAAPVWVPFVEKLSKRSGETVPQILGQINSGAVRIAVIWDEYSKKAIALLGYRVALVGSIRVAEMVWLTGSGRGVWEHLLTDFETYARDHLSCARVRPICRPGWARSLKGQGYRLTHVILEKDI